MKVLSLMVGPIMTNCYILCDEEAKVCAVTTPVTSRSGSPP